MKSALKVLGWNAALIVLGVIVIELIFGSWYSSNDLENINILRNGIWHYELDYSAIPEGERQVVYSRDRWGLRGNYGKPEDIDILTIGGSTTDQRYISDGATWQDIMVSNFQNSGIDLRVANAGVDGRTTFGHQHDFDNWFSQIDKLQPKYILFYVGINDMFYSEPDSQSDKPFKKASPWQQKVKQNSAIYAVMQALLNSYLVEQKNLGHGAIDYSKVKWVLNAKQNNYAARMQGRLKDYRTRFLGLLKRTTQMGAIPIVVSQPRGDFRIIDGVPMGVESTRPTGIDIKNDSVLGPLNNQTANGLDYHQILSLFNKESLRLCKQKQGICLDLANQLSFADQDFYDYAHNTRVGADRIGVYLYEQLQGKITLQ